ncbi:MAG: TfoX/Sxy family protein [Bacteroidota bacterium]
MAYDIHLADRIRQVLQERSATFYEKKMFGGLCFMVDDKMCVGIVKEDMMARIGPEAAELDHQKPGVRPMDFTGRPMKGYRFISPEGTDLDEHLAYWVDLCLVFNPLAKASKKRKKPAS